LAISGRWRRAELPNLLTMPEEGYDIGLDGNWQGIVVPKGTPRPIVDKLALGFKKMMEHKQAIAGINKLGDHFSYMGPEEFTQFWNKEYKILKDMAKLFKQ